jgi:hypothetical protein
MVREVSPENHAHTHEQEQIPEDELSQSFLRRDHVRRGLRTLPHDWHEMNKASESIVGLKFLQVRWLGCMQAVAWVSDKDCGVGNWMNLKFGNVIMSTSLANRRFLKGMLFKYLPV